MRLRKERTLPSRPFAFILGFGLLISYLFIAASPASVVAQSNTYSSTSYTNELLIQFEPSVSDQAREQFIAKNLSNATILESFDAFSVVQLKKEEITDSICTSLSSSDLVVCAEPNYIISTMSLTNDSYSSSQWSLQNSGSYKSYATTSAKSVTSSKGIDLNIAPSWSFYNKKKYDKEVVVAIIDTGIDIEHEDLSSNCWINEGEIPEDGVDNDDNGYVDDVNGWDFYNDDNTVCHYEKDEKDSRGANLKDNDDHGTHVAGIIGAVANNKLGIAGVASNINVKLMPLKIEGGPKGSGTIANAIKAIKYAERMGADICNISWGSSIYSESLEQVIKESDLLFIAAGGNSGTNNNSSPVYPASYHLNNIISVTFVTAKGKLNTFANYGNQTIDLAAPGVDILSTTVGNHYASMSGSSMAVPHVTGIAAMLYAFSDHLYPQNIRDIILDNLTEVSALEGKVIHPGIPDAYAIVQSLSSIKKDASSPKIQCSTSYKDSSLLVNVTTSDAGGSKLRVIKYLYGKHSVSDFEHGTNGTSITNGIATLAKGGFYTFYASDYAGNESILVYEVKKDTTPPKIRTNYTVSFSYKKTKITAVIKDKESGIKTVKYLKGKKKIQDFKASDAGTVIKSQNNNYSFSVSKPGTYTIYALDYQGNKSITTITTKVIKSSDIQFVEDTIDLSIGESLSLSPVITPSTSTDQLKYASSKESVVTVSSSGKITGIKKGKAVVTVTTASGKTASIQVHVF